MTAEILSGSAMRREILSELAGEVRNIKAAYDIVPGLVTILVGENPASVSYVTLKSRTALDLGFHEIQETLSGKTSEEELLALINKYNNDPAFHGILVQLPLPDHINAAKVLNAIDPDKDVDAFHPVNLGRLVLGGASVRFLPCTPAAVWEMLVRSGTEISGAEMVVVGRSNIVGKPLSIMMSQKDEAANATVTIVHTRTRNLKAHCERADILVASVGVPGLIKGEWIKPGATVIDVGVNQVGVAANGKPCLVGDVDFEQAKEVAGKITPVPGGVGPMTIAMLMKNTVRSAKFHLQSSPK